MSEVFTEGRQPELADLPVQVEVRAEFRSELVAWLESDLRWQVVSGDKVLRPAAVLTDDPHLAHNSIVILPDAAFEDGRGDVRDQALLRGALETIAWPTERDRLVAAVARGAAGFDTGEPTRDTQTRVLRVAGIDHGVGASTVALALGAWAGWSGARALVVGDDDLLALSGHGQWRGPGTPELMLLPSQDVPRELAALARPVQGTTRLRLVGGGGHHFVTHAINASTSGTMFPDVVIVDDRTRTEQADVIVAVADQTASRYRHHRAKMLVRTDVRVQARELNRLLAGPAGGRIVDDVRVRRAARAGRVPSALPGRWLRDLARSVATVRREHA